MHLLLALAIIGAPGDRQFIRKSPEVTLSAGQRTTLSGCVTGVWSDAVPANIQSLVCTRHLLGGSAFCHTADQRTVTAAVYLQREDAGVVNNIISASAGNVTYEHGTPPAILTGSQLTCFANYITSIHGVTGSNVYELMVRRDGSSVISQVYYRTTTTPAAYATAKLAGEVLRPTGIE